MTRTLALLLGAATVVAALDLVHKQRTQSPSEAAQCSSMTGLRPTW